MAEIKNTIIKSEVEIDQEEDTKTNGIISGQYFIIIYIENAPKTKFFFACELILARYIRAFLFTFTIDATIAEDLIVNVATRVRFIALYRFNKAHTCRYNGSFIVTRCFC